MDPEENFNPNTEVDKTIDLNTDPEENFNSNTEVDETPDSNMEENVTQRTGEKRKGRGAVVCSRLTKMKENEHVDVVFNQNGQRIGEGGKDLASYSGLLAASRVSIATYDNWHDVKGEARDRLWKFIKYSQRRPEENEGHPPFDMKRLLPCLVISRKLAYYLLLVPFPIYGIVTVENVLLYIATMTGLSFEVVTKASRKSSLLGLLVP
ncbi:hypothetical protein IFM89_010911 [Coptis chinensis]|uniref:Uncharacterized protein n=1 Tax=Coptis chinensis TaxID=261450 RepID=A0A835ILI7_9MAGN|nr:hypothetical protein IFM89_010911 [Coptis chinensis]